MKVLQFQDNHHRLTSISNKSKNRNVLQLKRAQKFLIIFVMKPTEKKKKKVVYWITPEFTFVDNNATTLYASDNLKCSTEAILNSYTEAILNSYSEFLKLACPAGGGPDQYIYSATALLIVLIFLPLVIVSFFIHVH